MSSEYITLEFYEVDQEGKMVGDDPIKEAYDVIAVPRVGDRLYIARTEKVLGIDPDKEHRHFEVVEVEWWYDFKAEPRSEFGGQRQIAIFCTRVADPR
jgi:hypothetical protein